MKSFSIKDVELITGIKAHTIRIWEQRYNLVAPRRTETNIRFYKEDDVKQFLNISLLLKKGLRISEIAKMSPEMINKSIIEYSGCNNEICACSDNWICQAMIELNEYKFKCALDRCFESSGFEHTMLDIVFPFLSKIQYMWRAGSVSLLNVKFIYSIIRNRMELCIDKLETMVDENSKKWVLMLPNGANSEIGLLFANYILKKRKQEVLYVGSDLTVNEWIRLVAEDKTDYILSVFSPDYQPVSDYSVFNCDHINSKTQIIFAGLDALLLEKGDSNRISIIEKYDDVINFIEQKIATN